MRSAPAAFLGIVVEILTLCGSLPAQSPCGNNGPGFTCSGGGQAVCQGSSWICNCGAQCSIPPPYIGTCTCGEECTGDGSWQCSNCSGSSIIIDTKGEGFRLTNVADGVKFKFFPNRPPVQISWTDPAFSNGFLVLDRNGDGLISDGTELFGKLTPQPQSATPNGCLALAVFDQPENGGNGDGFIDAQDAVYDRLRVWIDANHDGISELREMHTLKELGIARIDLKYHLSHYVDEFGNEFRYRSRIWDEAGSEHEVCYDVFLETSDRNQAVWHGGSVDGTESGTMCVAPPPQRVLQGCPFGPACGIHGWQCASGGPSPIILDISGHGFHLTDVANGVKFAFYPGQPPFQMSWTDAAYGNGFLALDRNGDGRINDGSELFGNITPQPPSATPNGHLALAVFDLPENGGNGNGVIDPGDAIYSKLQVWIDFNHNGVSEPRELYTLQELGIERIGLKYVYSPRVDQVGNRFRYRSKVWEDVFGEAAPDLDLSYDVLLQGGTSSPPAK